MPFEFLESNRFVKKKWSNGFHDRDDLNEMKFVKIKRKSDVDQIKVKNRKYIDAELESSAYYGFESSLGFKVFCKVSCEAKVKLGIGNDFCIGLCSPVESEVSIGCGLRCGISIVELEYGIELDFLKVESEWGIDIQDVITFNNRSNELIWSNLYIFIGQNTCK